MKTPTPDFPHVFVPGNGARALLLLHGTGGNETSLIPLGQSLLPGAALLSPRGKVLENGMPRFFRRLAEGIFDEADLIRRTHELADFLIHARKEYGLDPKRLFAVGYSNGANIAGSLLLLRPEVLGGAALLRPMVPLIPEKLPNLPGVPVLISAGNQDPICASSEARELADLLRRAGAEVSLEFENAGHGLTEHTVRVAQEWLQQRLP
ncbi:MAG TPA: alpha/beta hydrolase [Chthoniobacterales bacterium]